MSKIIEEFERSVARKVIDALLHDGWSVSFCHDDDYESERQQVKDSSDAVLDEMLSCGDITLNCARTELAGEQGNFGSFVRFVTGNGASVISDYGVRLEQLLEPVHEFCDSFDD